MGLAEQMFAGMPEAEGFGVGQYFDEGRYDLVVTSIKCVASRRPENAGKHFFTAEFEVLSSTNPNIAVGASATYQVKIEGNSYAFADIKNFIFALCLGVDPKNAATPKQDPVLHKLATDIAMAVVDEEYAAKLRDAGDNDALSFVRNIEGATVKLEAFKKPMLKKPGTFFTIHQWTPSD